MMRARLVSRVITGIYDNVLRPFGIQASQLNLLVFVAKCGPIRRKELGSLLHLDSSTLTRNLRVMETNGWIEEVQAGSDGRGFPVRISRKGEAVVAKAAPAWKIAQRRASELLGSAGKSTLMNVSQELFEHPA
jgi:DNA-binding MarR family transcriptional regulator